MEYLKINGKNYIGVSSKDCYYCEFVHHKDCKKLTKDDRCVELDLVWVSDQEEHFTDDQIKATIKSFLEFGEETFNPDSAGKNGYHGGYYSGNGWAARCLRYHLSKFK